MERTRDPLKLYMQRTKYLYAIFISGGWRPIFLVSSLLQEPTKCGSGGSDVVDAYRMGAARYVSRGEVTGLISSPQFPIGPREETNP